MGYREWEDPINQFNSLKFLYHLKDYSEFIERNGSLPPPALVSFDLANACNLKCEWCNSKAVLNGKPQFMGEEELHRWPHTLKCWGVQAVCIGGGGESLLNPYLGKFLEGLKHHDIETSVITNGTLTHRYYDVLAECCRYVGVSVDCGREKTFQTLKGGSLLNILAGIKNLMTKMDEVGYKFLIHPATYKELGLSARIARDIGVRRFHARPCDMKYSGYTWKEDQIKEANEEIEKIRELDRVDFSVYTISHKFDPNMTPKKNFNRCWGGLLAPVIQPGGRVGFCCDRRGDEATDLDPLDLAEITTDIAKRWGSPTHLAKVAAVNIACCPRCTYSPHSELIERVGIADEMMVNFI